MWAEPITLSLLNTDIKDILWLFEFCGQSTLNSKMKSYIVHICFSPKIEYKYYTTLMIFAFVSFIFTSLNKLVGFSFFLLFFMNGHLCPNYIMMLVQR